MINMEKKIDSKKIKQLSGKISKKYSELIGLCDDVALLLTPCFGDSVIVRYDESDGLMLICESQTGGIVSLPVDDAVEMMNNEDTNLIYYFNNTKRKS